MKPYLAIFRNGAISALLLAGAWATGQLPALSATKRATVEKAVPADRAEADREAEATKEAEAEKEAAAESKVIIKSIELPDGEGARRSDLPWLGVSVSEAGEALAAQLNFDPGVGLVVTYVASNSPAAAAGLQKNDVLVELQDQSLVLPAQLRKLVQARKEGDIVKLKFYRAGKAQTISATLAKSPPGFRVADGEELAPHDLHLRSLGHPFEKDLQLQMESLQKMLGNLKIDRNKIQEEVRRSVERARQSYQDALRQVEKSTSASAAASRKALEELARSGMLRDNKASVTVRSTDKSSRSMVKTDDFGTIVIVANPKLRLTAHDQDGKLVFDGEIESDEQRAKVPKEVWEEVEPMLSKFNSKPEE